MSASSEHESKTRQDYGQTTSNENLYDTNLEHQLVKKMNVSSVRTPVLRALPVSVSEADPEPDSTKPEDIVQVKNKTDNEVDYHISEIRSETEMTVDSYSNIVRTTIDNVGHIAAYPVIQETDSTYLDSSNATLIQAPLNTAIVQNVAKLPQNFTINVEANNITTIQNMSQDGPSNQTLWLPTLLATSASTADGKNEEINTQSGVSQIIITSDSYVNDANPIGRRASIVTETNYINQPKTSKVQILSNIAISKNPNYTHQYLSSGQSKEIVTPLYSTENHVYKLSTNVVSQKHLNNSVLYTKTSKNLLGPTTISQAVLNSSPIKSVSYGSFAKTKGTNKVFNKVNNGDSLNTLIATPGNTQCHILSRVVSGPNKMSVHSGRKPVNTFKTSKNSNPVSAPKNQSRSIKIIQQTGAVHKSEGKSWPVTSVTYKSQQPTYGVVDSNASKIIQKVGSPTHQNQQQMSLQKMPKGEHLVLQSPCGPVLISTAPISTSLSKGPHYVQSGSTPNLRYVKAYGTIDHQLSNISQATNQQLTAQILHSLSQPKLMLQPALNLNHNPTAIENVDDMFDVKPVNQKRIVFGDKSTLLTANDVIGMEERPNLSEQLRQYSFQALAFVMLDHTYALPAQKQPSPTPPITTVAPAPIIAGSAIVSPTQISTPISPIKPASPVIMSSTTYELPLTVPTSIIGTPIPVSTIQMGPITYKAQPTAMTTPDDEAASNISSLDDDRRQDDRGGSDTETAPEGEEEGKTRCICDFTHDDGYMICCDRCGEWQHVDCMGIDRQNIPDAYMCELCQPRAIDRRHARAIQMRKREELSALAGSDSDSSEGGPVVGQRRKRLLTVTTYTNTSGSFVTTYNSNLPVLPPLPHPSPTLPKRGPKRPKKPEAVANVRKGPKRKLTEKRVKRKKEMMLNRANKYNATLSNQSHWQESYEQAMTNHYSPELRAKIMKYSAKLGNTPNMATVLTSNLCTTVPHAGGKILIATKDLKENTPVIELRGKYMLSNQHRPQLQTSARAGSQKPGPYVFFYSLPKDNIQICVDTRTYGNEARFVRRSCKPNAELQHCIVKGTLHVYLVTIGNVQSNTEITVSHDSNGNKQPCACGNPKHCKVNGLNPFMSRKSVDYPPPREKRSRNRCLSASLSASSPVSPPPAPILTPVKHQPLISPVKSEKKSPIKHEYQLPLSPVKSAVMALNFDEPIKTESYDDLKTEFDLTAKEEMKPEIDESDFVDDKIETDNEAYFESVKVEHEQLNGNTYEEPVEEPKEKIEENEPVKEVKPVKEIKPVKEVKPVKEIKPFKEIKPDKEIIKEEKIESTSFSDEEKHVVEEEKLKEEEEPPVIKEEEKPVTPKEVETKVSKSACHDRSSRSSKTLTAAAPCVGQDSDDKTDDSQEKAPRLKQDKKKMTREERKMEAIMKAFERMEKAEQRKQEVKERQKRRESDPHPNSTEKDEEEEMQCSSRKRRRRKGRARTTSQSNRHRLNSADSDLVTSGDDPEPPPAPPSPPPAPPSPPPAPPAAPPRRDSAADGSRQHAVSEDLGLSSACLLVEAAVGSVESAFKQPKTKKTMATEWVGRSPERTPSPYTSPFQPSCLNMATPSLENLVRVASTIIGDLSAGQDLDLDEDHVSPLRSPPCLRDRSRPPKKAKRITRSTPPAEAVEVAPPKITQHSAKKRWLRQAISEESDSPIAESPPNEMVTPLKKRRFARESISYEQNIIVPGQDENSPNLTSEDSPVKEDSSSSCYKPVYGRDRTRSDSGQGSDDQCNMDNDVLNVNMKDAHDSEHLRRIIGVPTEDEAPADVQANNNNLELDEGGCDKTVPMDIDTTIPAETKIQESHENSIVDIKSVPSPPEKQNSGRSADTSGNSSPQRDEMDDIQKKIHSFHTENIQILKSRNKKPPKEKRKKVNLNFDLNMVDDQISIQLLTEDSSSPKSPEINGDAPDDVGNSIHDDAKLHVSPENIPLPPVESIPLPAPESIPLPGEPGPMPVIPPPEAIPLPEEPMKPESVIRPLSCVSEKSDRKPAVDDQNGDTSTFPAFGATRLFSEVTQPPCYNDTSPINESVTNMSLLKSAIDWTTLDNGMFERDSKVDELRSVQDILTRVNNMDSSSSLLLSGVLNSSSTSSVVAAVSPKPLAKPYCPRSNDPRLNPPPAEKPKPVRRKLSISEYRKRHRCAPAEEGCGGAEAEAEAGAEPGPEWSSGSSGGSSLSPQRLDAAAAAAADELEQRLHRELAAAHAPRSVFDAQPTASERQREDLSSRLRREFGLALPEEEIPAAITTTANAATAAAATVAITEGAAAADAKRCDR